MVHRGKKRSFDRLYEWLFSTIGYGLILIVMSLLFKKTIQIDASYFGFWAFFAAVLISILNMTVKPIIFRLTIPLTALTFGIFYPFINVFILQLVDWFLQHHFQIHGLWMSFFVAILISLMNVATQKLVIEPILEKE